MSDQLINAAREASVRILECAAFLFTDSLPPESVPQHGSQWHQIGVSLEYNGPVNGELRMWLSEALSKTIAVNMLGIEMGENCPEEREVDAVKEILNMILGNYLTEAYGLDAVFHLGIPRLLHPKMLAESYTDLHFWLDAEGQPFLLSIHPQDVA
jgi:CheY-specific phosphatase CheX